MVHDEELALIFFKYQICQVFEQGLLLLSQSQSKTNPYIFDTIYNLLLSITALTSNSDDIITKLLTESTLLPVVINKLVFCAPANNSYLTSKLLPEISMILRNISEVKNQACLDKLLQPLSIECLMNILSLYKEKQQQNSHGV